MNKWGQEEEWLIAQEEVPHINRILGDKKKSGS